MSFSNFNIGGHTEACPCYSTLHNSCQDLHARSDCCLMTTTTRPSDCCCLMMMMMMMPGSV
jgi:hypothetical protein